MMCRKPYTRGMEAFGCGQCLPCRFNRRRLWMHRMMLESLVHPYSSFVTLTYNDDNIPDGGSLEPRHLQLFLKRIRKQYDNRLRFFGVGEYGDHTDRPHYHLALFGHNPEHTAVVQDCWSAGFSYIGNLTMDSAQYIAGYVVKKMTRKDDERLQGRYPEFARMSLRPGIGAPAIQSVAEALQNKAGWDEIDRLGDVPSVLRHGRKSLPLGRYMRTRLRAAMNFAILKETDDVAYRRSAEMLDVYKNYLLDEKAKGSIPLGLKQALISKGAQKARNLEARMKIYGSKKGVGV